MTDVPKLLKIVQGQIEIVQTEIVQGQIRSLELEKKKLKNKFTI